MEKKEITNETLDQREKRVKHAEYVALAMLIIGVIMACVGAGFMDKIFKTYSLMSNSTVYQGLKNRDKENDKLEDVQKLMNEIENIYETSYVEEIDRTEIDAYVCNALIDAYGDRYAVYRDPGDTASNYNEIGSHVQGMGVLLRAEIDDDKDDFDLYLIDIYDGSPAEKAGLEIGDKITHVNGKQLSVTKYKYDEVTKDIKGETGTTFDITYIDAETGKSETTTVTRANAQTYTVRYSEVELDGEKLGYIRIRQFETDTDEQFNEALEYFEARGIYKYIFDLRDNSGGLKETVLSMLDTLLPEGLLFKEIDANGNVAEINMSDSKHKEFESITLINDRTASASELFTKALKDFGKTTVVGETSVGKGTVCTTFNLSNGGSVMVSTGKYLTKSEEDIEGVGIKPDYEMKLPKEKAEIDYKLPIEDDDLIDKAKELLVGQLKSKSESMEIESNSNGVK